MRVHETTVETNTLEFSALRAEPEGGGDRHALLFHGFPDDAGTFLPLMRRLVDAGYTAVAPYMRGYGDTETPRLETSNYSVPSLGGDVIGLVNAVGADDPLLIGHDWGATAVTAVSRLDPSIVGECVTIAVPPNVVKAFDEYPSQVLRSWYMAFFQLPGVSEDALRRDDFALIDRLWSAWSPDWNYPEDRIEEVKETFRTGDTVEASLMYYRSFYEDVLAKPPGTVDISGIRVPTLLVAGRNDGCIASTVFADAERCYEGRFDLEMVPGAGHFVHAEKPDRVADAVLDFVGGM